MKFARPVNLEAYHWEYLKNKSNNNVSDFLRKVLDLMIAKEQEDIKNQEQLCTKHNVRYYPDSPCLLCKKDEKTKLTSNDLEKIAEKEAEELLNTI